MTVGYFILAGRLPNEPWELCMAGNLACGLEGIVQVPRGRNRGGADGSSSWKTRRNRGSRAEFVRL